MARLLLQFGPNLGRPRVDDIVKAFPASRRRKIEKRAATLLAEDMTLQELRRARAMTQVRLAKNLGVAQKQISEIERRTDMHISILRRSIEAMGGTLSLIAEFPDRAPVTLAGIAAIGSPSSQEPKRFQKYHFRLAHKLHGITYRV